MQKNTVFSKTAILDVSNDNVTSQSLYNFKNCPTTLGKSVPTQRVLFRTRQFFCVCTCVWMTQPALWQQEKKVNISVCKGNSNALTHCNLSSVSAPVNTEALCSLPPPPVRRWVTETAELGTCSCLKFCYNKKCYFLHFPLSETDRGGRLFNFNWTGPDDK